MRKLVDGLAVLRSSKNITLSSGLIGGSPIDKQDLPVKPGDDVVGAGICLRSQHYNIFLSDNRPDVLWLEVLADNYLGAAGIAWEKLKQITQHYPVVLHCVGLGVGNTDAIDWHYCEQIKAIADQLAPVWISDHLCWTAYQQDHSHSLLPLPLTQQAVNHVVGRVKRLKNYFERSFALENIATYMRSDCDEMSEIDFLNQVTEQADCGILLDVNNLLVNAYNHRDPPVKPEDDGGCVIKNVINMLKQVNAKRVVQYHLAGHQVDEELLIDTHDCVVPNQVWDLYRQALKVIGPKPTCVEWDANIPQWDVLFSETQKAQEMMKGYLI